MISRSVCCVMIYFCFLSSYADRSSFRPNYFYISETDSYYKVHTHSLTWPQAKKRCVLEGATLYYPEDDTEAELVMAYMRRTERFAPLVHYIGVSDLVTKGLFETIDGRPISSVYDKWSPGEPNNKNGNNEEEDCVVMDTKTGNLNDIPCGWARSFICKKRNSTIEWNDLCDSPDISYGYNARTGKCYKFYTTPMTWSQAYAMCVVEQSYLAVINNAHEAEELVKITKAATARKINGTFLPNTVLLGFHNRLNDGWTTVKAQRLEESGFSSWGQQQTDSAVKRQCGAMFFNSLLKSVECNKEALFICEHDVDMIRQND